MGIPRFALFRPLQIDADSNTCAISATTGGIGVQYSAAAGTYGMLPSLLYALEQELDATVADIEIDVDASTDFYVRFRSATNNFRIDWTDTDLRDILGFTGASVTSSSSGGYYVATGTLRPLFAWCSTYGTSDDSVWETDQAEVWSGKICRDGTTSGVQLGTTRRRRNIEIVAEHAHWMLESRARTSADIARSLEYFARESRVCAPSSATGPNPRGCYLWYDADTIVTSSDYDTNCGVQEVYTSSPSLFVFISIEEMNRMKQFLQRNSSYWSVGLSIVEATAPDWDA